jgi:RNA polymerase sigma-70 factor (ECF subfamily)
MNEDHLVVSARRDRVAFGALYDRYYPRVMRYCLRRLFVREVAEDVTSEAFLHVAEHLPAFEGTTETDFRRWVFRIASNAVNACVRQTRRRQELFEAASRGGRFSADHGLPAVEHLDWPTVYRAVLDLDPRDQTILTLRYFADLSHDEIGAVIGAKAGAIRTALSRILSRLRARLGADADANAMTEGQP